jgi:H+/Cl- antiporter ClcA
MRFGDKKVINDFFSSVDLDLGKDAKTWTHPEVFFNLLIFNILKFTFNIFSLTLPFAGGAFGPMFTVGAGIGRLYGYVVRHIGIAIGLNFVKSK